MRSAVRHGTSKASRKSPRMGRWRCKIEPNHRPCGSTASHLQAPGGRPTYTRTSPDKFQDRVQRKRFLLGNPRRTRLKALSVGKIRPIRPRYWCAYGTHKTILSSSISCITCTKRWQRPPYKPPKKIRANSARIRVLGTALEEAILPFSLQLPLEIEAADRPFRDAQSLM